VALTSDLKTSETLTTRSTQRAQTSAERQHNRIAQWFLQCKLAMKLWSESTKYFFDNQWIRISNFGLLDPDGDPDRHQNLTTWSLGHALGPTPTRNFVKIRSQFFQSSDGQTDRQTDKQTDRSDYITSFFDGGNNWQYTAYTAVLITDTKERCVFALRNICHDDTSTPKLRVHLCAWSWKKHCINCFRPFLVY